MVCSRCRECRGERYWTRVIPVMYRTGKMASPFYDCRMSSTAPPQVEREVELDVDVEVDGSPDRPWITIVWNDPINTMNYVTHVFMKVFGYPKTKANQLMLDVHERGRAVVSTGPRERMELDVATLHGYGLWATLQKD